MSLSKFEMTGKSVLITGATGALGSSAAHAFAAGGAKVTLAGGNKARLSKLKSELASRGYAVTAIAKRPNTEESCDDIVAAAVETHGGLDALIVSSGAAAVEPALQMQLSTWDRIMDANVRQAWLVCRSAGRVMIDQGRGGKVVLVSSVRSRFATAAGTSAYGPSKAATDMLTRSLAVEWGQYGITVNAIAPTVFRSELTDWLFEDEAKDKRDALLERIPLGRLAEPDDHQGILQFLCSPASDFITGQVICIDGGFSAN
jgi:NAD(P)-dependent dehydrogenase (short-subunit alcohol dehydrogenase family)